MEAAKLAHSFVESYSSCASCSLYDFGLTPSSFLSLVAISENSARSSVPAGRRLCLRWNSQTAGSQQDRHCGSGRSHVLSTPILADGTRCFVCDRVNPRYGLAPRAESVDARLQFDPSRTDDNEGYAKRFLVGTGEGFAVEGFGLESARLISPHGAVPTSLCSRTRLRDRQRRSQSIRKFPRRRI